MKRNMMNTKEELKAFEEAVFANAEQWESRELGADEAFVKKSTNSKRKRAVLDNGTKEKTQLISIRLPIALIEDLKLIGQEENLGYQTLAKEVLQRFVDAEHRRKYNKVVSEKAKILSEKAKLEIEIEQMRLEFERLKQA